MTPASSHQQKTSAKNATRTLKGIAISEFSVLSARGYVTETNSIVDFRENSQDIPASYRADRFDDLPDFQSLVDNRHSDRNDATAENLV